MANTKYTGDRATKRMRWIARIWGALIVVYALLVLISAAWNWVTTWRNCKMVFDTGETIIRDKARKTNEERNPTASY